MNSIYETFGRPRVLLPVIHPVDPQSAMHSIAVAVRADADGIFLINQGMSSRSVLELATITREAYPDLWIGMNLLGHSPLSTLDDVEGRDLDAIWEDLAINEATGPTREDILFRDLPSLLEVVVDFVDVVTTSGPGTGMAADKRKLQGFRALLGDHSLALASGVTVENVEEYLPYVDAYIVGTGIEEELGVLDLALTAELADRIHSWG